MLAPDAYVFSGHIACDVMSRSEIVVPLIRGGNMVGLLDLDRPRASRFDADDWAGREALVAIIMRHLNSVPPA